MEKKISQLNKENILVRCMNTSSRNVENADAIKSSNICIIDVKCILYFEICMCKYR